MALQLSKTIDNATGNATGNYWRIHLVSTRNNQSIGITPSVQSYIFVELFTNQASRENGDAAIYRNKYTTPLSIVDVAAGYNYLKTLDDFANAQDC